MTQVRLEQAGRNFLVECRGHATGNQDVCAAVSTLTDSLYAFLACCEDSGRKDVRSMRRELSDDAWALLQWSGGRAAEAAFDLVSVGFVQLAEAYPQNICVNQKKI